MDTRARTGLAAAIAFAAISIASAAQAQQTPAQGTTSGPAAGTPVEPSTVTQKKGDSEGKATSAGAPGMSGPKGSENGQKPDKKPPN